MPAGSYPATPHRDSDQTVQLERDDGGTTAWCQSGNARSVFTPSEMLIPTLVAGIEQGDTPARFRIATLSLSALETVTQSAREP